MDTYTGDYGTLPKISASRITLYRLCAKKYYYTYINKSDSQGVENVYTLFGTALHKAIEGYYRAESEQSATAIFQEEFMGQLTTWQDTAMDVRDLEMGDTLFVEGKKILKSLNWDQFKPIETEYRFLLPFPAQSPICYVDGIIDMIDDTDRIIDHKSKKGKKPDLVAMQHDPQFILYYWAFQQIYKRNPMGVYWHHLRNGEVYNTHVDIHFERKLEQLTVDICTMLEAQTFARKTYDAFCYRFCPFHTHCYGVSNDSSTHQSTL